LQTEVSRLQNEFTNSEDAEKTAETNVEGLKRQLNEKDIQLKQLQSLTIKTPKELEKATGPGATTGQKETETK
jgi:flagellar biosynthesis chaperone FliJ